ncbi:SCO family protein [Planococcus lenghuensis]|uniref:Cytochrome c oxidase assembly protein n=1 Tax=Planococcus lenghuensis TaxID=2213202 RepID=A0A1Q2KXW7_9BACL|nr:SCO family protein [Planococcus lenghuensis]AQQ53065.1 cytochrome c oxidase assembly protein [Planococcus lenghuensis]
MKRLMQTFGMSGAILIAGCSNSALEAEMNWEVQDFSYMDQRGEEVSLDSLEGTPWLAAFIFTSCETVCPPMTFNLTDIQGELEAKGIEDYKIVAFSVDPENDTPEQLQEYLSNYPVPDESKWHLLTGYSQEEVKALGAESFKTLVQNDPNSDQVVHGTTFYLVNGEGTVVKDYNGYQDVPVDMIAADLETLIEEQS